MFCAAASAAVFFGAEFLMGIFIDPQKTQIIQIGTGYLKTEGACYCGIGILFLLYGYFRAVERPKVSLLLTILSLGTRVVLAYACAPLFGAGRRYRSAGRWRMRQESSCLDAASVLTG